MNSETTTPDPEMSPSARPRKHRLAMTAGGLFVAVLLGECLLWLVDQPRFSKPHTFPPQFKLIPPPDDEGWIRHVNKPAETIRFRYERDPRDYFGADRTVEHVTNSLGFRGGEFPLAEQADGRIQPAGEKPAGTIRIVFLGDSITFGEGVHDNDTFVERVAGKLGPELAASGRRLEVYNLGVGGHNASDAVWTWQRYAVHLDPDLVVYTFTLNDAEERLFRIDANGEEPGRVPRSIERHRNRLSRSPDGWPFRSRLVRGAWSLWAANQLDTATAAYYRATFSETTRGWKSCAASIDALQQIEPPLLVAVFPLLFDLANHPFRAIHERIAARCGRATVADLWEPLARRAAGETRRLWVDPADQHPNEIAHATVARQIAEAIRPMLAASADAANSRP